MTTKNLPEGSSVQAVMLSKANFPHQEDASAWVKAAEGDPSDMEDGGDKWIFHQFPPDRCQAGTNETHETEHPGVFANVCKQSQESKMNPDVNDMDGGERYNLETGHDTLPDMPQGASTLTKLKAIADDGYEELGRHKGLIEHPEIKEYAEAAHGELKDASDYLQKALKEWYPEVKPGKEKDAADGDGPDDDLTDNQYQKCYKTYKGYVRKTAEGMEYMHDHPNSTEPAQAGAKVPFEAKCLMKAMDRLHIAHKAVEEDMPMQAHPDVKELMGHLNEALPEKKMEVCGLMKDHFPEVHKALGWEGSNEAMEADSDEKPDDHTENLEKKDMPEEDESEAQEERNETEAEKESEEDLEPKSGKMGKEDEDEEKVEKMVVTSMKQLKSGDHYIQVCSCGVVMGQCKCVAKGKKTVLTEAGCDSCRKKLAAGKTVVKAVPTLKAPTKPVAKAGANVIEPPMDPAESPDNVNDTESVTLDGDAIAILRGVIDYLNEVLIALGGDSTSQEAENPYEEPNRPAPGKEADEEGKVDKDEMELADDEEEPDAVTKEDDDGDEDDDNSDGNPFGKSGMAQIAKALEELNEVTQRDAKRLALIAGGTVS